MNPIKVCFILLQDREGFVASLLSKIYRILSKVKGRLLVDHVSYTLKICNMNNQSTPIKDLYRIEDIKASISEYLYLLQ
jgi:hypothetical protein